MFLGVDGGGTKTEFVLLDAQGQLLATHQEGTSYYLEIGLDGARALLERGIMATLERAGRNLSDLRFAFFGLPAYGEDSNMQGEVDRLPAGVMHPERYRCGSDMICSWAGSLVCQDGISVISGTGSMAYGQYQNHGARAGGWGELFSDEGSAYWIAREGLTLFSRMSDGRAVRGPLYQLIRQRLALDSDLDLCGHVYSELGAQRSAIASMSKWIAEAAQQGDQQALLLFDRAAAELVDIVDAVRLQLQVSAELVLPVSYSGGLFNSGSLLLDPFRARLESDQRRYQLVLPKFKPSIGAALYAARCAGHQFSVSEIMHLAGH
jgi:N-acetylglucosamine kinase-like BadF-type ATPase